MRIRDIITDTLLLLALCAAPPVLMMAAMGLYTDASGIGWYWPNLGGYHWELNQ